MPMPSLLPLTAFCNDEDNFMMHVELYVLDILVQVWKGFISCDSANRF